METSILRRRLLFLGLLLALLIGLFAARGALYRVAQDASSASVSQQASVQAPAGVAGKTVYLGATGGVIALDARSGAARWRFPAAGISGADVTGSGSSRVTGMALCDGALYVALSNGPIVALRASDGARLWSSRVLSESNAPTVTCAEGVVYAAAHVGTPQAMSDRLLVALHPSDGHELWRFVADEPILSAPAAASGDVLFGTTDRLLYVVDGQTGALRWRSGAYSGSGGGGHLEGYSHAQPVGIALLAQGATVYINAKIKNWNDAGQSYIEPDTFVRSISGPDAFGVRLGAPPEGLPAAYPPVVSGGVSYVEGGGGLWATSISGDSKPQVGWFYNSGGAQFTGPALGDGRLYVCAFNGEIYALAPQNGHELWHVVTQSGAISQPPAFAGGALFVAGGSVAYALRASDGAPIWHVALPAGSMLLTPLVS